MTTAGEIIEGSLRLIGQLPASETLDAADAADALAVLNMMLESWSTERLSVFTTQDQVFTWPASQRIRTLGPTGDFVGNRPIDLESSTYFRDPSTGVSYDIQIINQDAYNGIALKTVTSTYPQVIWMNTAYPNVDLYLYPVPTRALEFHFVSVEALTNATSLATDMTFPPGYLRAFRYALACELAPEYGVEPSSQVQRIAMTAKRTLKRINNPGDIMSLPAVMIGRPGRFNVYSGLP